MRGLLLAVLVFVVAGCAAAPEERGAADVPELTGEGPEGDRIELPEPAPVDDGENLKEPPPVWLVVDGEAVQAGYGEFCDVDVCISSGTPTQLEREGELATADLPAQEEALVVIGSGGIGSFDAGVRGWEYELDDGGRRPGAMMSEAALLDLRELETRRLPENEEPAVEYSEVESGGVTSPGGEEDRGPFGTATVFELESTGEPGDRALSVFLDIPADIGGTEVENPASYHWRLSPGQPGENPPPPEEEFPGELTEVTVTDETARSAPVEEAEELAVGEVEEIPFGNAPSRIEAGEGYLWVTDFIPSENREPPGDDAGGGSAEDEGSAEAASQAAIATLPEGESLLLKADPATGEVLSTIEGVGGGEMAVGAGAVWMGSSHDSGKSVR